ncbi:cell cycle arrest protein BUB2, partial [Phenoliferia sp. Uapishka_3]
MSHDGDGVEPLSDTAVAFLALLSPQQPARSHAQLTARLDSLRKLILLESIPQAPHEAAIIRPLAWKLLLRLHLPPPDDFGVPDIHPLLGTASNRQPTERPPPIDPGTPYVQGMNVLAAPFLYVLPTQLEAFACFCTFIEVQAPRYVRPTLEGVHAGLHVRPIFCPSLSLSTISALTYTFSQLVDLALETLDPALYKHLLASNLTAEIYAFPSILTFCACTPPLDEVLELWDFLLAWGVGLNASRLFFLFPMRTEPPLTFANNFQVLAVVSQLFIMRDDLLATLSPMKLLRTFPPLKTREIIPLTVQFVADLPSDLYSAIIRHPWDDAAVMTR